MSSESSGDFYQVASRAAVPVLDILGVPVYLVNSQGILDYIFGVVSARRKAVILHANVFGINLSYQHPWLRQCYQDAQLVFCDGDGVRWACGILGLPVPNKVTYNVWLWELAAWCETRQLSLFVLGGRPGLADRAATNLCARYPRLRLAGTHHGYFAKEGPANQAVVDEINGASPDILLVCFGMPHQERWVFENLSQLRVHVILTGGAAIDYGAGAIPVVPRWMAKLQLEWLFRFLIEPVRMFRRYIIGNPLFLARVFLVKLRKRQLIGS